MTTQAVVVRGMRAQELPFAASLTLGEGWHSETLEEFEGFFQRDPAGCLVAEYAGERAGIGVATAYGSVGFLGQIVVHPGFRGRGVGGHLVRALVDHLRAKGVHTIYLDATAAGAPLYERHGFRPLQPSLRFNGTLRGAAHVQVRPMTENDLDAVCALDRLWWGADRGAFLRRRRQTSPGLCFVLEQAGRIDAYVFARRRNDKLWIGPWCAAPQVESPELLLGALVAPGETIQVHAGTLAASTRAVRALERIGMRASDNPPWRMAYGTDQGLASDQAVLANGTSAKG